MEQKQPFRHWHYYETGVRHISENEVCQDRARSAYHSENGVAAAVVSDGAGSCRYAQYGAEIAADIALQKLTEQFEALYAMTENDFVLDMVNTIRRAFAAKAEEMGCGYYELSATLLCAAMAADGRYLYFHIGDGMIVASDEEQGYWIMSQYQHTVAPNYTTFITSEDLIYQYGKGERGFSAFFLCSDGPEGFLLNRDGCTKELMLLMQMSHLFPKERMCGEIRIVTAYFKGIRMVDDASYAVIADKRFAGDAFFGMNPANMRILLNMKKKSRKKFLLQMAKALDLLSQNGTVGAKQLARVLHIHKEHYVRKRLALLLRAGIISEENGVFHF